MAFLTILLIFSPGCISLRSTPARHSRRQRTRRSFSLVLAPPPHTSEDKIFLAPSFPTVPLVLPFGPTALATLGTFSAVPFSICRFCAPLHETVFYQEIRPFNPAGGPPLVSFWKRVFLPALRLVPSAIFRPSPCGFPPLFLSC